MPGAARKRSLVLSEISRSRRRTADVPSWVTTSVRGSNLGRTPMRWLAAFVCGLALPLGALAGEDSKWTYVDIQPQGNHKVAEDQGNFEGNNLASVPKGEKE